MPLFLIPWLLKLKSFAKIIFDFLLRLVKVPIALIAALIVLTGVSFCTKERVEAKLHDAKQKVEAQKAVISDLQNANSEFEAVIAETNARIRNMQTLAMQKTTEAERVAEKYKASSTALQARIDDILNAPVEDSVCDTLQSDLRRWYSLRAARQSQ